MFYVFVIQVNLILTRVLFMYLTITEGNNDIFGTIICNMIIETIKECNYLNFFGYNDANVF